MTKSLLIITAVFEAVTGLALLASPALAGVSLAGSPIESIAALIITRIAGAALLAIGLMCWLMRNEGRAAQGVIVGLLIYNLGVVAVLAYAGMGLSVNGTALWPATAMHLGLSGFCIAALRHNKAD